MAEIGIWEDSLRSGLSRRSFFYGWHLWRDCWFVRVCLFVWVLVWALVCLFVWALGLSIVYYLIVFIVNWMLGTGVCLFVWALGYGVEHCLLFDCICSELIIVYCLIIFAVIVFVVNWSLFTGVKLFYYLLWIEH
jgi:hypothetical protein